VAQDGIHYTRLSIFLLLLQNLLGIEVDLQTLLGRTVNLAWSDADKYLYPNSLVCSMVITIGPGRMGPLIMSCLSFRQVIFSLVQ
jgi:hypothetical protein